MILPSLSTSVPELSPRAVWYQTEYLPFSSDMRAAYVRTRKAKPPSLIPGSSARNRAWARWLVGIFLLAASPVQAQPLTGQAAVIDGDTIEIRGQRIRLFGIDAPESDQLCRGNDSLQYRCGAKAANELDRFIGRRAVSCVDIDERTYKRVVAVCTVGGVDLADWMVRDGLALDWPRYSKGDYAVTQSEAQRAGRGIWAGRYVAPWVYRACKRNGGRPSDCSDEANTHR